MIHYQNSHSRLSENTSRFVFHTTHDDKYTSCFEVGKPASSAEEISRKIIEETKERFRHNDVESLIRTNFRTVLKAFCELHNNNGDCCRQLDLLLKCVLDDIRTRDKTSTEEDLENSQLLEYIKHSIKCSIERSIKINVREAIAHKHLYD